MTQIARKWLQDRAVDHAKLDSSDSYTMSGLAIKNTASVITASIDSSGNIIANSLSTKQDFTSSGRIIVANGDPDSTWCLEAGYHTPGDFQIRRQTSPHGLIYLNGVTNVATVNGTLTTSDATASHLQVDSTVVIGNRILVQDHEDDENLKLLGNLKIVTPNGPGVDILGETSCQGSFNFITSHDVEGDAASLVLNQRGPDTDAWVQLDSDGKVSINYGVVVEPDGVLKANNAAEINSLSGTLKRSLLTVDHAQVSNLDGGSYFGKVGIKENPLNVSGIGRTWVNKSPTDEEFSWSAAAVSSNGKIQILATTSGEVLISKNYGTSWQAASVGAPTVTDAAMSVDGRVMAVTSTDFYTGHSIYVSTDYGSTWGPVTPYRRWFSIAMSSDGRVMVAGDYGGYLYISKNFGSSWDPLENGGQFQWSKVALSSDGQYIIANTNYGYVYFSDNYGEWWNEVTSLGERYWTGAAISSDGKIMAVCGYDDPDNIYISRDYGISWNAATSAGLKIWDAISMSSNGEIMVASNMGVIYVSTDYGVGWAPESELYYASVIAMSSDAKVMVVPTNVILESFANSEVRGKMAIEEIAPTADKRSLLSVDQMQLSQLDGGAYFGRTGIKESPFTLKNIGYSWVQGAFPGETCDTISMSASGEIQITTQDAGFLYVSRNYGYSFEGTSVSSSGPWAGSAMSSDGKVMAAAVYGGPIYISKNYGYSWVESSAPNEESWAHIAMSADGQTIMASGWLEDGGFYISRDFGANWNFISLSGALSIACSSDAKIITASRLDYGKIMVSYDSGSTWTESEGFEDYGGALAMSADGKYQVIASTLVYVSTDYGRNWSVRDCPEQWYSSVAISADGKIMATLSPSDYIYTSTDHGQNFSPYTSPQGDSWNGVAMSSDGKQIAACAYNHGIYNSIATSSIKGNLEVNGDLEVAGGLSVQADVSLSGSVRFFGNVYMHNLPYEDPESEGQLYISEGVLMVSQGGGG